MHKLFTALFAAISLLTACTQPSPFRTEQPTSQTGRANPASVNCVRQGGTLQIVDTGDGQIGVCIFPSGQSCEEWALLRGECAPERDRRPE
ncbi:putative hemolysin [Caballeronia concitans]|uniref:putative hemolysin n=1 Tax=Caballeronia concitans TaxID=1777133 RepID=UPI0009FBB962|nr:DUF333 domain-containing protein [Caballeronia concitans]